MEDDTSDQPNKGPGKRRNRIRAVTVPVQPKPASTIAVEAGLASSIDYGKIDPPKRKPPPRTVAPVETPLPKWPSADGAAIAVPNKPKRKIGKIKRQPTGNYLVGNCRPPEHGKIKPGEIRNPRGRPRDAKGMNTIVRTTMEEKVVIRTSRGEKRVMRIEALFLKTVENGFNGNYRAALAVINAYSKAVPEQAAADPAIEAASSENDDAVIAAFRAAMRMGEEAPEEDDEAEPDDDGDDGE